MKFYAENFKRLRESAGMTQDEIAKKLNVTKQVVCMWERSGKKPDYAKIPELIGLLKCECSDICDLAVKEESDYDSLIYAVLQEELKHLDIDGKRRLLRTIVVYTTDNIKFRKERAAAE